MDLSYFCCSTLPSLNDDIKDWINLYGISCGSPYAVTSILSEILSLIQIQASSNTSQVLSEEYNRMVQLYKFRLKFFQEEFTK